MNTVIEFVDYLNDGGAESLVRNYAEAIDPNIVSIIVLTLYSNKTSANHKSITAMGIPVISLYPKRNIFFRAINKLFRRLVITFWLKRKIATLQPCAIHIHSSLLTYLEPIRDSIKNINLFYTCHVLPQLRLAEKGKEHAAAKILIRENKLQIIALHEEMANELNKLLDIHNTIVLNNGININKFKTVKESRYEICKSINIPINKYIVGHVGRFAKVKNHLFLLDIFNQLLKHIDAHLILVGDRNDGPILLAIKEEIKRLHLDKNITILSNRSDVNRIIQIFNVFLFPSLYESFGLALLEAQAAGIRCVISDTVPDIARVQSKTIAVGLNKTAEYWCNIILDENITQQHTAKLEEYDIFQVVKRLQTMYTKNIF